jgi:hypothetical protein
MTTRAGTLGRVFGIAAFSLFLATPLAAQLAAVAREQTVTAPPGTVRVAPGARYAAGGIHRWLFGAHYRRLWTTSLDVPVLDLPHFAGGLIATQRGGGFQTSSLRFRAGDGREFSFRSLDKDPSVLLPPELKGTVVNEILQDQTSAIHPAGALVVPLLLEAVGVPHTTPELVVLPDDPRLGEFRAAFAGMLGIIEERPGTDDDTRILPGARRVVSSDQLFARIEASADDQVDGRQLLAARLMDVFLGDWDRHRDQWRWATRDSTAPRRWIPIPRDRDQAFVRFDGLLLAVARGQAPQLVNFGPGYAGIEGATWNGRELDRRFLVGLERGTWDSTARRLQAALTDSVLQAAVARLPADFRPLDSLRLVTALQQRRDHLPEAARRFYRLLANETDVHATDEDDVAILQDRGTGELDVALYRAEGFDEMEALPYFARRFRHGETGEVRLYLHGGKDRVVMRGPATAGITVRAIGGKGTDTFIDSTGSGRPRFYDADAGTVSLGAGTEARPYQLPPRKTPTELPPRDWGARTVPLLWAGLAPDVGVLAGGGLMWTDYGFRQQPYASRHLLRMAYATGAGEGKAEYRGEFRGENRRTYLSLFARASGIETIRFNGLGNDTRLSGSQAFYRVRQIELSFQPAIVAPLARGVTLSGGPAIRYTNTKDGNRYIDQARTYGAGAFGMVGGRMELAVDTRDLPLNPRRGVALALGGAVYPSFLDVRTTFGEVHGSAATYLGASSLPLEPVLALRVGARQVFGDAPFQEAAYIGDARTARLGRVNRYGGDRALWGNVELRLGFGRYRVIVPGEWGAFGLGDVGRVYLDGESSDTWHGAYGGGLWFGLLGRANTISIAYAQSRERGQIYVQAGMAF